MATTGVTPPNHPIYGVNLSPSQIVGLIQRIYPGSGLVNIEPLVSGQSFNNRIYFLTLKHHFHKELPEQVVLKVVGRFFDGRKIENEVVNLTLLKKYCADIPTPAVVAWSEDGKVIHSALTQPDNSETSIALQDHQHKWIMMTRMPGRKLTTEDLTGEFAGDIADQLVDIVGIWHWCMPEIADIGNFKINHDGVVTCDNYKDMKYRTEGLLFADLQPTERMFIPHEYYTHILDNKIHNLKTKDVFASLRKKILPQIETLKQTKWLQLPFFDVQSQGMPLPHFTHQDLAPRNFLVTDTPDGPVISGVVDFEWAGNFPDYEEYLNTYVKMKGDWPAAFWNDFMQKLADTGLPSPVSSPMTPACWDQGCDIIRLIEDVAPWWLEAGHVEGEELERQLDEVAERVDGLIKRLSV